MTSAKPSKTHACLRLPASAYLSRNSPPSQPTTGAEAINREGGQRYIAIKYSVVDRDLGSTEEETIGKVEHNVKLPTGFHLEWSGEYKSQKRASKRMAVVIPITVLVIFVLLYTMFRSFKWSC